MDKKEQTINNLKVLAARLAPTIYFRYLVMNWGQSRNAPVIKLYENKPVFCYALSSPHENHSSWEGENGDKPICIMNAENLVGTSLGGLSVDDDYSEFIVSNKERTK